jgi:serine/threonine-protein kinase
LHHPGIVAIFDVGEDPENHNPYIVMECVDGEPLNRILAREKKLALAIALQLTEEVAEALDYAQGQGVIHRDIKPGNILVTKDGHAKIVDFGIAKLNLAHFTLPGRVLGTPAYMAPEQLNGEGVDGRSDLFSLGVILYAMVTGHSPFQGNSATTVCFKVANREPVAASALDLSLPRELDEVIAHAMAKDPEDRYQRGAEFAEDVRQLQQLSLRHSTTMSLRIPAATGTRTTRTGRTAQAASRSQRADGMAQAVKWARTALRRTPIRDLILGTATVLMLVIAGVESKLLAPFPKVALNESEVAPSGPGGTSLASPHAQAGPDALGGVTGSRTAQPAPAAAATARPRKVRAPASHATNQIVVPSSNLDLAVQHQFKDATLFVWIDDKLALTRPLRAAPQKRLVVFNGLRGAESETLKVPAGKHVLRVRALSSDKTIDLSKTVSADFIGGADKSLQVAIEKHNTVMRLIWQ